MKTKLTALMGKLNRDGLTHEAMLLDRLIKLSAIPGIDSPVEEIDIDEVGEAISHLENNPGSTLHLDNPIGTFKWTIDGKKRPMPFHYGEVITANNPSDDAGWDVVIAPEASEESRESDGVHYIPAGHNLLPVGYIPVNPDQGLWARETSSDERPEGKMPPIGNDKIILAPNGKISADDAVSIEAFFNKIWNFNDIVWL